MGDLFRWFLLGLRFSAINSGIKQNLMMSTGTCGIKLYARCNIFKKKITNMTFGIIYILVQVSFLWDCFRVFFFYFSSSVKHGSRHFYSAPPHHKTYLSYYLLIYMLHNQSRLTKFSNYIFFYIRSCHPMEFQTLDPLLK